MELASGTPLRREPEDTQALLLGNLQLESEALTCLQGLRSEGTQPCPLGALNLEEETLMSFPG